MPGKAPNEGRVGNLCEEAKSVFSEDHLVCIKPCK